MRVRGCLPRLRTGHNESNHSERRSHGRALLQAARKAGWCHLRPFWICILFDCSSSLPQHHKLTCAGSKAIGGLDPITPHHHETYLTDLWRVNPRILESFYPQGAVPPGGVRKQHPIPARAAEHNKVIVTVQIHRHYDGGLFDQVLKRQPAVADPLITSLIDVPLEVERREALLPPNQQRVGKVFLALDQRPRDLPLRN